MIRTIALTILLAAPAHAYTVGPTTCIPTTDPAWLLAQSQPRAPELPSQPQPVPDPTPAPPEVTTTLLARLTQPDDSPWRLVLLGMAAPVGVFSGLCLLRRRKT